MRLMNTRLSFSAITTYSQCGKKYDFRYNHKLRSTSFHAALAFGSSIDSALNTLLKTKDLTLALQEFDKSWAFQFVNRKYTSLAKDVNLVYAETDFDLELLQQEDIDKLNFPLDLINPKIKTILEDKAKNGWNNLSLDDREFYNYANWLCMSRKGHIMLHSYNKKVLPRIRTVLAVQKENYLENAEGDKVVQYLDLIVEWEDGRNVLMDNKTSKRDYKPDSAGKSPQLISYYHSSKEEYALKAVGFIVLKKEILKNKIKICATCGHDGSGGRHKTCDAPGVDTKRCNGDWLVKINPECYIDIIINNVSEIAEELVLDTFADANEGIKKENWYRNLSACDNGAFSCEYLGLCWRKDSSELIDMSKENET